ncbi:hypothetical protein F7725_000111 [Dissostichus mawsoni]|uniref:Uncharacterized protein n=1 Tax=Dissostichus mawsoni TaxID=36200 RepID=A0A7J5ZE04_DISMA|nr:hypothetical protein F7725_000111 [Dissostichus mawsoni]
MQHHLSLNDRVVGHGRANRICWEVQFRAGLSGFCRLQGRGRGRGLAEGPTGPPTQVSSCASSHPAISPSPTHAASLGGPSCHHSHVSVQHAGCSFTGFTHGELQGLLLQQLQQLLLRVYWEGCEVKIEQSVCTRVVLTCLERLSLVWVCGACWACCVSMRACCPAALLRRVWGWELTVSTSVEQEALDELSSTEAAAAVVSVESQLSCPVASLGPTVAAAPAAEVLEAGAVLLAGSVGSDSDVVFVHWRAFFYRVVNRLIRPGSLKKMLFFTRSPLTWECSIVTRQAKVVPARVPLSPGSDVTLPECMASSAAPSSPGPDSRNISKTCSKMSTWRRNGGWKDAGLRLIRSLTMPSYLCDSAAVTLAFRAAEY